MNTTEIRELNTAELDLVSGGVNGHDVFNGVAFTVAGMNIVAVGSASGHYEVEVSYGDGKYIQHNGKV